jgi:hypothetical protein
MTVTSRCDGNGDGVPALRTTIYLPLRRAAPARPEAAPLRLVALLIRFREDDPATPTCTVPQHIHKNRSMTLAPASSDVS